MRNLKVKQPKEFMQTLLEIIPNDSRISFEGNLKKQLLPKVQFTETEEGCLIRNTKTPKQDFWVFKIDNESRSYLKNDFINRIGIATNVIHIMIESEGKLLFTSYDNFNDDCVLLKETFFANNNFMEGLIA